MQPYEDSAFVRAAVAKGAAGVEVGAAHGRLGCQGAAHLLHHHLGALQRGALGQHHHPAELTVVFLGNEGAGPQAEPHGGEDQAEGQGDQ